MTNEMLGDSSGSHWDKYKRFLPIAEAHAQMSKYPGTKVGCVILGTGTFEIRASGWNGAARGSKADEDGRLADKATRLSHAVHAEQNALANAARGGTALGGSVMVVTHLPCMVCAKLIVQAGITAVVAPTPYGRFANGWADDHKKTRYLFNECGVTLVEFENPMYYPVESTGETNGLLCS